MRPAAPVTSIGLSAATPPFASRVDIAGSSIILNASVTVGKGRGRASEARDQAARHVPQECEAHRRIVALTYALGLGTVDSGEPRGQNGHPEKIGSTVSPTRSPSDFNPASYRVEDTVRDGGAIL